MLIGSLSFNKEDVIDTVVDVFLTSTIESSRQFWYIFYVFEPEIEVHHAKLA